MLRVSIAGYGNVGKSLYKIINDSSDLQLVAVYSRRKLDIAQYRPIESIVTDTKDTDVLLVAMGSYKDMFEYMPAIAGKYNTVDSYDNHATMQQYKYLLHDKQKQNNKISVVAAGWDPGLLSMERTLMSAFINDTPATFWGKGISQGHTNTIKSLPEVHDALQLTVPKQSAIKLKLATPNQIVDAKQSHIRLCYVCCDAKDKSTVAHKIASIPDYFKGYKTIVKFVSQQKLQQLKQRYIGHAGTVIANDGKAKAQFCVNLHSNADFTAQIMLKYAKAIPNMLSDNYSGVLDCMDIPLKYLVPDKTLL